MASPAMRCSVETDVLFVVDIQSPFIDHLHRSEDFLRRALFLIECAVKLGVPIIASEQVPERLGYAHPRVAELVEKCFAKDTFSCFGDPTLRAEWERLGRTNAILIGAETHICVSATALDLTNSGYEVMVCPDATSARTEDRHKLGMERMRDSGVTPAHTESVVYEWLATSKNPGFREVLGLVKQYAL